MTKYHQLVRRYPFNDCFFRCLLMDFGCPAMFMRLHRLARFTAAARDFSHPHRTMSTRARSEGTSSVYQYTVTLPVWMQSTIAVLLPTQETLPAPTTMLTPTPTSVNHYTAACCVTGGVQVSTRSSLTRFVSWFVLTGYFAGDAEGHSPHRDLHASDAQE